VALDTYSTAQYACERILAWQGITVASATDAQKAGALTLVNEAYREVCRGVYLDEDGGLQQHVWSFLTATDTTTMSFAAEAYYADLPSDYDGMVEPPLYPYSATAAGPGLNLKWVSPHEFLRRRRDSETSGIPEVYTVRPKTFVAATGQKYEMAIDPAAETAVVLQIRYRQLVTAVTYSALVAFRGPTSFPDLIVQCVKAREELWRGQVLGPETRKYQHTMREFVRHDAELFGDSDIVTSFTQLESGLSV